MHIDIVSVFPEYFDVLKLSLLGKAQQRGLLTVTARNLRDWTHDVHHSVDDTPVGGGAGMVMKPEIWAECLDDLMGLRPVDFSAEGEPILSRDFHLVPRPGNAPTEASTPAGRPVPDATTAEERADAAASEKRDAAQHLLGEAKNPDELVAALDSLFDEAPGYNVPIDHPAATGSSVDTTGAADAGNPDDPDMQAKPILIFPNPSAPLFTQADATDLSHAKRLIFGCGRYEGIDARVPEYYARQGVEVREYSIGDYVLNGGEVAVSAMIEAIVRLIPGFMGNPESIVEESYTGDPLLEHRQFTRPTAWRGLAVSDVLTSGDHGKVDRFRRDEALERTSRIRPDLIEQLDCKALSKADRKTLMLLGWEVSGHHPRRLPPEHLPVRYF
ncbi:tRNA (guanosine(37)-N1)-methyltransferase TrmD [Bifidobacterium sp. SMB2]|uniref:tRNA (guanine-N(1)-)-methyltransferase n=1 Tax=Bifidobacterium saimiriisciurei TaxID=2661627 RepID=A0ABX0CDD4_9BIFI|nr:MULTISPECIES: tRNA (guanine(37)-N(1))-methyltransferase [Bifidobacterium]NEG96218.1 tRNA (guanosine(37)-N1)-methyltransferase TrmD [Bifidobacterium sp. SMB2]NEH12231.1 tRNA (guanosine(37)-N1)-methyltransferase TrmD [Bifidobacterium saimiriisciurei]